MNARGRAGRIGGSPRAVSGHPRLDSRLHRLCEDGARGGRPAGGGGGSPGADHPQGTRGLRSGSLRGIDPALWGAPRLWRPSCGLHRLSRCPQTPSSGPPGGGLGGQLRQAGLPPRPADSRAAHPARQGDFQHLHRPGPPRRDCGDVRGLPRAEGVAQHRHPHSRSGGKIGRGPADGWGGLGRGELLRHHHPEAGREGRSVCEGRSRAGLQPPHAGRWKCWNCFG